MIEFSHEANAAMSSVLECLKTITDTTLNTRGAHIAAEKDMANFLHRLGKASLAATRAFELFVAAVSESARTTGVFPTVLPRRPQPAVAAMAASVSGARGGGGGAGVSSTARSGRTNSVAVPQQQPSGSKTARGGGDNGTTAGATNNGTTAALGLSFERNSITVVAADGAGATPTAGAASNSTAAPPSSATPAPAAPPPQQQSYRKANPSSGHGSESAARMLAESPSHTIATGAYMLLDVLVRETMSREAVWYSCAEGADEALAIALYSSKPRAPSAARLPLRTGIVGAVLRSGIAISVAPEAPTESNPLALCVPIFPPAGRTYPIGAIALYHKATDEPYTVMDESITANWTMLAGRYMTEYGVDLTSVHFDPFRSLLHFTSPTAHYVKLGYSHTPYDASKANRRAAATQSEAKLLGDLLLEAARLIDVQASEANDGTFAELAKQQQLYAKAANIQSYSSRLASAVANFPPPFRIFHTIHHNHFTAVRGARLTGSGVTLQTQNLMDVAEYVQNLEETWKRTTEDLHGIEQEHVSQMEDFRSRKRKLKAALARNTELQQSQQTLESKYEALKVELTAICGRPVVDDSGALTGVDSGAAGDYGTLNGTSRFPSIARTGGATTKR